MFLAQAPKNVSHVLYLKVLVPPPDVVFYEYLAICPMNGKHPYCHEDVHYFQVNNGEILVVLWYWNKTYVALPYDS